MNFIKSFITAIKNAVNYIIANRKNITETVVEIVKKSAIPVALLIAGTALVSFGYPVAGYSLLMIFIIGSFYFFYLVLRNTYKYL